MRVVGMKPVAAGAASSDGVLLNEDVARARAGEQRRTRRGHSRIPIASRRRSRRTSRRALAGVDIEAARVIEAFDALSARADCVIVEGAGGFIVPLGPNLDSTQLARALALPVVLVVGMRLGCLNHALLTRDAIARAGLRLAGWVANHIDPEMLCAG